MDINRISINSFLSYTVMMMKWTLPLKLKEVRGIHVATV